MKTRFVCDPKVNCIPALLMLSVTLCSSALWAQTPPGWREVSFAGHTDYRLGEAAGQPCWQARAEGSASGLVREQELDVSATPWLVWQWHAQVPAAWPSSEEKQKAGDDFQARVYVVKKGWLPWQTRAINYVWSRQYPPGSHWPNPFASQAEMVVVQGPGGSGQWQAFARNVQEDFRRYHQMEVDSVDAIAIMTDGDNTGSLVQSCYRLPKLCAAASGC